MEDKENLLESLLESAEEFGKTSFELYKLKALDKVADLVGSAVPMIIALFTAFMFLIMASIGIGFWLGELLGKLWYGFSLVAGFYGMIGIIVYFIMFGKLKRFIADSIIKQALK